jgi:hypothetical protein
MQAARTLLGACLLLAVCLPLASSQEATVQLTCLNGDETLSRHASYPITWSADNIPANTMLSLRLQWMDQARGAAHAPAFSWLVGAVLDAASQRRMAALSRSATGLPTIESGKYLWDVAAFCRQNKNGSQSVCQPGVRYRLQIILRAANDPCADNLHCTKPRSLFQVATSDGTFTFAD